MTAPIVTVVHARPAPYTAAPAVTFRLHVSAPGERLHAMALRCQVQIDATRRRYSVAERSRLYELFGDASQLDRQLRPVTWSVSSIVVPTFEGEVESDLTIACTYDLEVAAAKYLHAIRGGEVPLAFLFTGTIFRVQDGTLTIEPVSWETEATFRMPASVWRATMDQFFPSGGWLRLQADTIDRLQAFRGRNAVVSWDEAIELLLARAESEQPA